MAKRAVAKPFRRAGILLGGFAVLLLAVTLFAFPVAAAAACPSCYGFTALPQSDIYIERGMAPATQAALETVLANARTRVVAFYGSVTAHPRILACATPRCFARLRGGRRAAVSYADLLLVISPRGTNGVIAAHELAHLEFHHRIGIMRFLTGAVPAWFDEGLAVEVSGDPRYVGAAAAPCRAGDRERLPESMFAWQARTPAGHDSYALAACRVDDWLRGEGSRRVLALISALKSGVPFAVAYR